MIQLCLGHGERTDELAGIRYPYLALCQGQWSGPDDDGEPYPISRTDDVPDIVGSLIVGHTFVLRPSSVIDDEVGVIQDYYLCDVRYYLTQVESDDLVCQCSGRHGHSC